MENIRKYILKLKNINGKEKEKILIKVFTVIIIIYFLFTNILGNKGKDNKEELKDNINIESTESEKIDNLGRIYVHITGFVNKPGVLEMEEGKRLSDAVESAGGLKEGADIKYLNLAKKLIDGEKIYIPNTEEVQNFEKSDSVKEGVTNRYYEEQNIGNGSQNENENININNERKLDDNDEKININKVGKEELMKIPGVGNITAGKIIEYRKEKGSFKKVEEIKEIEGIGDLKYEKIKEKICV